MLFSRKRFKLFECIFRRLLGSRFFPRIFHRCRLLCLLQPFIELVKAAEAILKCYLIYKRKSLKFFPSIFRGLLCSGLLPRIRGYCNLCIRWNCNCGSICSFRHLCGFGSLCCFRNFGGFGSLRCFGNLCGSRNLRGFRSLGCFGSLRSFGHFDCFRIGHNRVCRLLQSSSYFRMFSNIGNSGGLFSVIKSATCQ